MQEVLDELTLPNDGSYIVDAHDVMNDDEHDGTNEEPQEEQQAYEELHEGVWMDGPQLQLQPEEGDSDDDEVSPIDNEYGEIFLEIDLFGMRDLREDDFIDEEL